MDIQKKIFDIIREQLSHNYLLVDVVGDILGIGSDSSYRRIRGEKKLTVTEVVKLCTYFNISIDFAMGNTMNNLLFKYNSLDMNNMNNYQEYIKQLTETISDLSNAKSKEMYFTAEDIPIFHFLPYRELMLFRVYIWFIAVSSGNTIDFKQFLDQIKNKNTLFDNYDKMLKGYNMISSTEIWTKGSIDPLLRLIDFYYDMGLFGSKEMATMLCSQLLSLIKNVHIWTENGKKNDASSYRLFLSPVNSDNCFMLLKKNGITTSVTIRLYTINSIITTNQTFCEKTDQWINNIISKSTLLSGTSARERNMFFKDAESKILNLVNKIKNPIPQSNEISHF
ncbi:MAG: hypothetical protein LBD80_06725 [Tannerella sp.]|jgi:hypothetical protein|nr:hypothetical protein [Tannerella sp.]